MSNASYDILGGGFLSTATKNTHGELRLILKLNEHAVRIGLQ